MPQLFRDFRNFPILRNVFDSPQLFAQLSATFSKICRNFWESLKFIAIYNVYNNNYYIYNYVKRKALFAHKFSVFTSAASLIFSIFLENRKKWQKLLEVRHETRKIGAPKERA